MEHFGYPDTLAKITNYIYSWPLNTCSSGHCHLFSVNMFHNTLISAPEEDFEKCPQNWQYVSYTDMIHCPSNENLCGKCSIHKWVDNIRKRNTTPKYVYFLCSRHKQMLLHLTYWTYLCCHICYFKSHTNDFSSFWCGVILSLDRFISNVN